MWHIAVSSFAVFTSDVIKEQNSIRRGLPRRAVEEICNSNAKQRLSCDKLVGHVHIMLHQTFVLRDGTLHVVEHMVEHVIRSTTG